MRELIQAEQALGDYTRKHARHILAGVLGNNAGTVDHPTRTNFVYVRLHGDANQVVEAEAIASFPHTAGIVVAVELIKRNAASRYQVLGIASNILFVGSPWAGTVGEHAAQHQRRDLGQGGFDPLDVYNRALVNLRGRAQATPNMTLYVERGFYFIGGTLYEWTGGNSAAFTAPAGSFGVTVRRCDLLYINTVPALAIVQGATTSDGSVPPYPTTPYPCIPIAYVYLSSGMTSIQESNIKDARVILTASDGTPVAHNLLSATHGDTLTGAVAAGDLIIGNDTPKWARLAITVPAANVRNVVGVDNGETKPSWKVALDGTAAADVANAAAAGTSLVFSHRDHVHRGVVSVNKNGGATLYGAVTLSEGSNITLTQAGQNIAIAAATSALTPVTAETIAWEDIRVSGAMARVGSTAPALTAFGPSGSLKVLFFEQGHHDEIHFEIQMPHAWKVGTKVYPHVHWAPVSATAGNVVWELEYAWQDIGGTFGAPSNLASDATAAGGTAWVQKMTPLKGGGNNYIDGAGLGLSSMLVCRLHRNAGAGSDTLAAAVAFLEFDLHYQVDGLGSDLESAKSTDARYELVFAGGDVIMA